MGGHDAICVVEGWGTKKMPASTTRSGRDKNSRQRPTLPRTYARSTIGGGRLNFRVRNGNGCDPAPMTTGKLVANRRKPVCQTLFGVRACGTQLAVAFHRTSGRPELSRSVVKKERLEALRPTPTTEYPANGSSYSPTLQCLDFRTA